MIKIKKRHVGHGHGYGWGRLTSFKFGPTYFQTLINWAPRRWVVCYEWLFFAILVSLVTTVPPLFGGIVVDRVMAIVNDEIISLYELNQRVLPYAEKIKKAASTASEQNELLQKVTQENLNLLIDEKLADQEIKRLNIKVGESEVKKEIERFKSVNRLTDKELREALAVEGSSLDEFGLKIKEQILRGRLVNREIRSKIVITSEEVLDYYESHPEEFGGEKKYLLKNIVMNPPVAATPADKTATINRLKRVRGQLIAGETFDMLAIKYSDATNAVNGGSLGLIGKSALASQIQEALEPLKPLEFTEIIETDQGYQIFFVEKIEIDAADPFEKVKNQIEDKLYNQVVNRQYEKWLQDLRTRSHIKLVK